MKHKFTVDRRTWLRGEGSDNSRLRRRSDGKKCCLGFALNQMCGLPDDAITDIGTPGNIFGVRDADDLIEQMGLAHWDNKESCQTITGSCGSIIKVNDDKIINDDEREAKLKVRFAALDIEIAFIN